VIEDFREKKHDLLGKRISGAYRGPYRREEIKGGRSQWRGMLFGRGVGSNFTEKKAARVLGRTASPIGEGNRRILPKNPTIFAHVKEKKKESKKKVPKTSSSRKKLLSLLTVTFGATAGVPLPPRPTRALKPARERRGGWLKDFWSGEGFEEKSKGRRRKSGRDSLGTEDEKFNSGRERRLVA